MATSTREQGGHAVVIGASMGGLLAARALADSYEQVTLVERDAFPPAGEHRRGVPQGRHVHALLAKGREILEAFFPGFTQDLVDQGALLGDVGRHARWFDRGGYHCRYASNLPSVLVSRPRLEWYVRTRLLALPNVRAIEGCDVLGLTATEDRARVTGVRVLRRQPGSAEEVLGADLVVDASGRGSRMPAWLDALGYAKADEERVEVKVGYTSQLYRRRPQDLGGDRAVIITASPELRRLGVLIAQEGDRWMVTLAGYLGDYAPSDESGFLEYARNLAAPDIYEALKDAEPLSDLVTARFPASQRRRYERLRRFPEGLLVFGDAICSFNPVYGQGMTVAALEATALRACLDEGRAHLAQRFFRRAARVVDSPWQIAVGGDLRIPEVEGKRTPMVRFINWYVDRVHVAARHDPVVARAFQRVSNLVAPPPSLLRPGVALRVLRGNLRRPTAQDRSAAVPAAADG
ncbi:MAG TPA: monooxygenase [Dehalococcoidia bacterium]